MSNMVLITFIVCVGVVIIMVKQINKITQKIDAKDEAGGVSSVYANFSAIIQEKIRAIKADIDHTKNTPSPTYVLKNQDDEDTSLEFLADNIRKLVFFETLNSKRKNPKDIESELFELLSNLDKFINEKMENGEELANSLRDELAEKYQSLQD